MAIWIRRLVWVALVLGLIITNTFLTARRSGFPNPSITSYGPSGRAVFAELLREAGYTVRIDGNSAPRLKPGEVPIYLDSGPQPEFLAPQSRAEAQFIIPIYIASSEFADEFGPSSEQLRSAPIDATWSTDAEGSLYKLTASATEPFSFTGGNTRKTLVTGKDMASGKFALVEVVPIGRELMVRVNSSYLFNNEYISEHDNARFALDLVGRVAKPGSTLVFCEAGVGNFAANSLWQDMGPWAHTAYLQLLGVLLLGVWCKNRVLGARSDLVFEERGARDLVDGLGGVFGRGKLNHHVLKLHQRRVDQRIQRLYTLKSRDANVMALLRQYLPEAVEPYEDAFVRLSATPKPTHQLIHALNALDQALDHWENRTRKAKGQAGKTSK